MRLTEHTDYALRMLIYLGVCGDRLTPAGEVADIYGLSKNHLLKVATHLTTAGFVQAVRGHGGGIRLALPPGEINIGAVVRYTETDMSIVPCFCEPGICRIEIGCLLRPALQSALNAFLSVLDGVTLADLLRPKPVLEDLFGLTRTLPS